MSSDAVIGFPRGTSDEPELLLRWLSYHRGVVVRKIEDLTDEQAWCTPQGALTSLVGIINHLTCVEWRWIDGGNARETFRTEAEFMPGPELAVGAAVDAYRDRAATTDLVVRSMPSLTVPCLAEPGADLRWVLLHLINETARHAGHADAVRELLDGTTDE
jgi:hypothetical protein